ncbi:MAG: phage tail sheath subtilisin-like domain-containing protein [Chthoniobacteraceae bacterium]
MPEYLAPGVYVEETSFRAKSIEGVGTSTTAFVGPTRRGPIVSTESDAAGNPPAQPELLTSFGDFERMFGGVEDLVFGNTTVTNYLAHSVLQFFNEGGSRLYVARVANQPAPAATSDLGAAGASVIIRSRFGGAAANGRLTVGEIARPVTRDQLESFVNGSLLRVSDPAAAPASLEGGPLPANLTPPPGSNMVLNLTIGAATPALTFLGVAATLTATSALPNPVVIAPANREFRLRVNGELQVVQLPIPAPAAPPLTPATFAPALQAALTGVDVTEAAGILTLATQRRGTTASIQVVSAHLGFQAGAAASAVANPATNNVADLAAVTIADIKARIAATPGVASALEAIELSGNRFALRTLVATSTATVAIRAAGAGETSAHSALGLPAPGAGAGTAIGAGAAPFLLQRSTFNNAQVWHTPGLPSAAVPIPANRDLHALSFSLVFDGPDGDSAVYDDLAFGRDHPRLASTFLPEHPTARADALFQPIWFDLPNTDSAAAFYQALFPAASRRFEEGRLVAVHQLTGGNDGQLPVVGTPTDAGSYAAAFEMLRSLEDISIVAAPGHSAYPEAVAVAIRNALIAHAERPRAYRIAVLDSPPRLLPGDVRIYRAAFDSHRAALYYPWVTVPNPLARPGRDEVDAEINLPPSGFICGIYARNDTVQSVSKAPANEIVRGALRFESDVNFAQQQLLNPLGVNCLRYLSGRGYRVWGARTASSDPEWKYVNVRRFFLYLEASIDRGTQWAVFENNGPRLWTNVRETVEAFLYNEWISGNLLGATPKEAFFVRCDRSTMTQNDLDNGRLICLIGVAALKPAEFVIFRIGQKTADERT